MKPLIDYFTEKIDETNLEQLGCDTDLYETILALDEKLDTTLLAITDLYETLLEMKGE